MLKFNPPAEPENFDIKVRKPGNNWLEKNPDKKRPKDYWSNFKSDLAEGTGYRVQGKEKKFCHNIQKYGLFLLHSKLYEISLFRFCILCTQEP